MTGPVTAARVVEGEAEARAAHDTDESYDDGCPLCGMDCRCDQAYDDWKMERTR